ncbi:MAG: lamin tail domain-containing protein, partial [Chthoniobacteraceae bacterium]
AFNTAINTAIDVDQWLRASAALALAGVGDNYITSSGAWHNLKLYHRADGRILYLPWDLDFQTQPADAPLIINPDISAITNASAANLRLFYQHLHDIIATSFNATYLTPWVNHYQPLTTAGGNWGDIITYVNDRVAFVNAQIAAAYPSVAFAITTNGGADFSATGPNVTLAGSGWINVRTIVVQSSGLVLNATWTTGSSWQISLPIAPGANVVTLQAFDFQGNLVGSDTITITGTGTVIPAAAGNVVISELHYNPAVPTAGEISAGYTDNDDFEFIELRNIGTQTVNLAGCQFVGGIDYAFPITTLAPGAYTVIARRTAAFALRHSGVPVLGEYYQPGANFLDNGGEEIALIAASGLDIVRFSYGDGVKWPATPDGTGPSLVLIAAKTNPDPANPLHWRASAANHGNPRASDALALPASLTGDSDGDGINNEIEHAIGAGAFPKIGREIVGVASHVTFTLERSALADVSWDLESSPTLSSWATAGAYYEITARSILPGSIERVTLRTIAPAPVPPYFLRPKLTAKP